MQQKQQGKTTNDGKRKNRQSFKSPCQFARVVIGGKKGEKKKMFREARTKSQNEYLF